MKSSGRVYFFPLIILTFVVNSVVIKAGKVPGDPFLQCPYDKERTRVQFFQDGQGIFRIKVCACNGVDDLSAVTVAETEDLCQSSGVHLDWDRNATIDRLCMLTKPLNFHPHGHYPANLVFCPSSTKEGLWNQPIPLQLVPAETEPLV